MIESSICTLKSKMNYACLEKLLLTLGFILVFAASMIIARTPVVSAYEISIYSAYPGYFWILVIAAVFCGLTALFLRSFVIPESVKLHLGGFVLLIVINFMIILLPVFRGYFIPSGGDQLAHIGWIIDLVNTGHFGITNIYPVTHIISTKILLVTGFDIRSVMYLIPPLFYLIYVLGVVLLARVICQKFGQIYLVLAAGSVMLYTYFNYLFFPTQNILFLLPLLLLLLIKANYQNNARFGIGLIIMLIVSPFVHPLGSLIIAFILALFVLASFFSRFLNKNRQNNEIIPAVQSVNILSSIIIFVMYIIWFSRFDAFQASLRNALLWIFSGEGTPPIDGITKGIAQIDYSIWDLIIRLFLNNGHTIIYGALAVLTISFVLLKYFRKERKLSVIDLFFAISFICLFIFAAGSIFGSYIGLGSELRLFCWPLFFSIFLIGMIIYDFIKSSSGLRKIVLTSVLFIAIFVSSIVGVFNTYYSPLIDNGDIQVPYSSWRSQEWFHANKIDMYTMAFEQTTERARDVIYGRDSPKPYQVYFYFRVPERLNYTDSTELKDIIDRNFYTIISSRIQAVKNIISPNSGLFHLADLNKIYVDNNNHLIYSSAANDHIFLITQERN